MKLVIFDADGTLTPQRTSSTAEFERRLLPGVAKKCARLRRAGVTLAVASNQSARRDVAAIEEQAEWTVGALCLRRFLYETDKARQKPAPVMLLTLMRELRSEPADTLFVGDQDTDRLAADAAGVEFAWADEFFY